MKICTAISAVIANIRMTRMNSSRLSSIFFNITMPCVPGRLPGVWIRKQGGRPGLRGARRQGRPRSMTRARAVRRKRDAGLAGCFEHLVDDVLAGLALDELIDRAHLSAEGLLFGVAQLDEGDLPSHGLLGGGIPRLRDLALIGLGLL